LIRIYEAAVSELGWMWPHTGPHLTAVGIVSLTFSEARIQIQNIYGSNDC